MSKKKVLIIEDEEDIVLLISHLLKNLDCQISKCASAEEALQIFPSKRFDLVILDVMLPQMDGFTLCRRIRETSKVPVLFLSANAGKSDLEEGYKAGGTGYVKKPFSLEPLLKQIQSLLN